MGTDKSLLPFGGTTLMEVLAGRLAAVFSEVVIVVEDKTKCRALDLNGKKICEDLFREQGPLAGLYTGLAFAEHRAACVLTCDMPFVDEGFLREFASQWNEEEGFDGLCLEAGAFQPFPGIYTRESRHLIHLLLERGESSLRHFFQVAALKTKPLPPGRAEMLVNMNTKEDYAQAMAVLAASGRERHSRPGTPVPGQALEIKTGSVS